MRGLYKERYRKINAEYKRLIARRNKPEQGAGNGIYRRYRYPVLTAGHAPVTWRYDLSPESNPYLMERFGINGVFNAGAIKWQGKYLLVARVEGNDRKSFFAIAESPDGVSHFRFRARPLCLPAQVEQVDVAETNVYDLRLTAHEDGWVYGVFCSERKDPAAPEGDLSSALASAGIVRSKDLEHWERLPDIRANCQQRNVVLHPEFVNGKYALYTRPQEGFITAGANGGIGWALIDDIARAEIRDEKIINFRQYHTVKELKNGEGPPPVKTPKGWLHLAHGVRACAAGLRYVLYLYLTALDDPSRLVAEPGGYFMAPQGDERVGDVSNVLFSNGWIADDDGAVYIYYASCDTRVHVAVSSIDRLLDYCLNTAPDGLSSAASVDTVLNLIEKNQKKVLSLRRI